MIIAFANIWDILCPHKVAHQLLSLMPWPLGLEGCKIGKSTNCHSFVVVIAVSSTHLNQRACFPSKMSTELLSICTWWKVTFLYLPQIFIQYLPNVLLYILPEKITPLSLRVNVCRPYEPLAFFLYAPCSRGGTHMAQRDIWNCGDTG